MSSQCNRESGIMNFKNKVIGVGETILDILFKDNQPVAAVAGGSSFNSIISVGRAGVPCTFVGYTGADIVGQQTVNFMKENNVGSEYFQVREDEKSAISLAFLNKAGDASYVFYKQPPHVSSSWKLPPIAQGDVMLYGSYYAACTGMRPLIMQMQEKATEAGAIIYYDLNFRRGHLHELESLMPVILSNFRQSTIVRGSADDFEIMYGTRDARQIYQEHIRAYCPIFICTAGAEEITVCTPSVYMDFTAPKIDDVVSTVGAGDNFNAGFACALVWQGIRKESLSSLSPEEWQSLIRTACLFAGEACRSTQNYISTEFGQKLQEGNVI